jgi:hypothetical protein
MQRTHTWHAIVLLGTGAMTFAQGVAPDRAQAVAGYAAMCMNDSANMPVPYGDADLKGNPKLETYCQCFAGKFADRALQRLKNPGPPRPLKQSTDEERAMRNDCRRQLGLPVLTFPQ